MFYYLYEVKNEIDDKIYVGVHKTKNINDGYMGSGKVIKTAIKKYGLENFSKTILKQFSTAEEMFAAEKEIVTEDFLCRKDVYNLRCGGFGGFDFLIKNGLHGPMLKVGVPLTEEHKSKISKTRRQRFEQGAYDDARKIWSGIAKTKLNTYLVNKKKSKGLLGKKKTDEHKKNLSKAMIGKKNPNYPKYRKTGNYKKSETVVCTNCGHSGFLRGMSRWHFDKCKNAPLD